MVRVHRRTLAGIVDELVEAEELPNGFTLKIKQPGAERALKSNATRRYDPAILLKKTRSYSRDGQPVRMSRLADKLKRALYLEDNTEITFFDPNKQMIHKQTTLLTVRGMEGAPTATEEEITSIYKDAIELYKENTDLDSGYCFIRSMVEHGFIPRDITALAEQAYEEVTGF